MGRQKKSEGHRGRQNETEIERTRKKLKTELERSSIQKETEVDRRI